ncbi:hypothetical protein L2E82_11880 [Cichorium intybus]|uniref:Uncharacterized protein n=1 Tax=Cichorium intybus TaxID=13427 RepID=A0ACB9GEE7_CICIN|nr:hypothetical protein L2E82_11880 [Cichorium intybus]
MPNLNDDANLAIVRYCIHSREERIGAGLLSVDVDIVIGFARRCIIAFAFSGIEGQEISRKIEFKIFVPISRFAAGLSSCWFHIKFRVITRFIPVHQVPIDFEEFIQQIE